MSGQHQDWVKKYQESFKTILGYCQENIRIVSGQEDDVGRTRIGCCEDKDKIRVVSGQHYNSVKSI